jgi:hypothetical protein
VNRESALQTKRLAALRAGGWSAQELAEALLEQLRVVVVDDPLDPMVVAALGHAAAIVALLPRVPDEDDLDEPPPAAPSG